MSRFISILYALHLSVCLFYANFILFHFCSFVVALAALKEHSQWCHCVCPCCGEHFSGVQLRSNTREGNTRNDSEKEAPVSGYSVCGRRCRAVCTPGTESCGAHRVPGRGTRGTKRCQGHGHLWKSLNDKLPCL